MKMSRMEKAFDHYVDTVNAYGVAMYSEGLEDSADSSKVCTSYRLCKARDKRIHAEIEFDSILGELTFLLKEVVKNPAMNGYTSDLARKLLEPVED